jgi:hypothetical protein
MLSNQRGCAALLMFPVVLLVAWWIGTAIASTGLPGAEATGFRWGFAIVLFGVVMTGWAIVTEPGES